MTEDYKVQFSVSLPPSAQYAKGDMANFRGETVAEVAALFDQALESDGAFLKKATDVSALLNSLAVLTDGGVTNSPAAAPAATQPANPPSEAAPAATAPTGIYTCAHGKRTRYEGKGAKGPYVAHFCPQPKGSPDQCKAVFED